jgi:hypothetical protein
LYFSTGQSIVSVQAAEVVIEALEDGKTRLTRLGGDGEVRWKTAATAWKSLADGKQVVIEMGHGDPATVEAGITAEAGAALLRRTLPAPAMGRSRPRARDNRLYGP